MYQNSLIGMSDAMSIYSLRKYELTLGEQSMLNINTAASILYKTY
jgi:hypothetical protein